MIVAIDGLAGSGKSSLGMRLARELAMHYIDTGAMYRAAGMYLSTWGDRALEDIELKVSGMELRCEAALDRFRVFLEGMEVTEQLRDRVVGTTASKFAVVPAVRSRINAITRDFRSLGDLVVDGRDIGTVVFPEAELKIFLTASPAARAQRRFTDQAGGRASTVEQTRHELEQRDHADTHRSIAPAALAPDAILLDTTDMSQDEAYGRLRDLILERRNSAGG
jgi:CMP/dCMP kinase